MKWRSVLLPLVVVGSCSGFFFSSSSSSSRWWTVRRRADVGGLRSASLGTTCAPTVPGLNATVIEMRQVLRETNNRASLSDEELAWFARDRRGDVLAACAKAERYAEWRRSWGGLARDREGLKRLARKEASKRVGYLSNTRDLLGRPVVVVVAKRHSALERDLRSSQALCVDVLESALEILKAEGREQCIAVVDLRNTGPGQVDIQFLIWLVNTLRNYYPKRFGQIALVDPPQIIFQAAWDLIRPYLGKHAALVTVVKSAQVRDNYFPKGRLPMDLRC